MLKEFINWIGHEHYLPDMTVHATPELSEKNMVTHHTVRILYTSLHTVTTVTITHTDFWIFTIFKNQKLMVF